MITWLGRVKSVEIPVKLVFHLLDPVEFKARPNSRLRLLGFDPKKLLFGCGGPATWHKTIQDDNEKAIFSEAQRRFEAGEGAG